MNSTRFRLLPVAQCQTMPATVLADYVQLAHNAELFGWLDRQRPTVVLAAGTRSLPGPAQHAPPWQLEAVLGLLRAAGLADLGYLALTRADPAGHLPLLRAYAVPQLAAPPSAAANLVVLATLSTTHRKFIGAQATLAQAGLSGYPAFGFLDATTVRVPDRRGGSMLAIRNQLLAGADLVGLDRAGAALVGGGRPWTTDGGSDREPNRWWSNIDLYRRPSAVHRPVDRPQDVRQSLADLFDRWYRWPVFERQVYESWLFHTDWGQLFLRYQAR